MTNTTHGLLVGDSDILLPRLIEQGQKFDLILTDPPYNVGKDFGNDTDKKELDEYLDISRQRIAYCRDLLADNGSLLWFSSNYYVCFHQIQMYESGLFFRGLNVWKYDNGARRSKRTPVIAFDPFLWFSRSDKEWTYNADDVRVPYRNPERTKHPVYKTKANGERYAWTANPLGALRGNVWEFPTLAGARAKEERTEHPTQKPEALFIELLKAFMPKDKDGRYCGNVLDPFMGSGTTAVACELLNAEGHKISWTGIELEQKWADVTHERLSRIDEQRPLFPESMVL